MSNAKPWYAQETMDNKRIAAVFEEIADLLELQGGNQFRIRSYRNAAQSLGSLSERLEEIAADGRLENIPNIGNSTAEKIREILETGSCKRLKELRRKVPRGLPELMRVPRLGPRRVSQLHDELGVNTLRQLEKACGKNEVRENSGEIEAALNGKLPTLIEGGDICGDLHCHSTASDGKLSIREMAKAAREFGHDYLAITDHSKRVAMANGLDDRRLRRHAEEIRKVDQEMKRFWLLAGIECDILKDGKLDLKEKTLAALDWVIASAHYDRALSRKAMTERIVNAVSSGLVHCLGHPTGRRIGQSDEIRADWDKVFEACSEHGVFVEINSQPDRLDLPDRYLRQAREAGVRFVVSTDAHGADSFANIRFGINVARRGGLEQKDVLNTKSLTQLRKELS
jgi:histidinol phosphatase-like PHP family hydrolase